MFLWFMTSPVITFITRMYNWHTKPRHNRPTRLNSSISTRYFVETCRLRLQNARFRPELNVTSVYGELETPQVGNKRARANYVYRV